MHDNVRDWLGRFGEFQGRGRPAIHRARSEPDHGTGPCWSRQAGVLLRRRRCRGGWAVLRRLPLLLLPRGRRWTKRFGVIPTLASTRCSRRCPRSGRWASSRWRCSASSSAGSFDLPCRSSDALSWLRLRVRAARVRRRSGPR